MNIDTPITNFTQWRCFARQLLDSETPPDAVHWQTNGQDSLFPTSIDAEPPTNSNHTISRLFLEAAATAACYRNEKKWALLYRIAWRLTHGEPFLMQISSDDDIRQLTHMAKAVHRDSHKMKAFVRFRKLGTEDEMYIAWHQPSHLIVERTAPFFTRRFSTMNWAILTPDCSAYWREGELVIGDGLPRDAAPKGDDLEALWLTFYWHIFNPARIKVAMMKSEMPMKFWHTLPEAALIPAMLHSASARVKTMLEQQQE